MKLLEALVDAAKRANETSGIGKLRREVATALTELATAVQQLYAITQLHSTALEQLYETQMLIILKLKEKSIDVGVHEKADNKVAKPN
jgi:hypothetical protein